MSNEVLAVAVQRGDSAALSQLWEQVRDYAYTIVMRYTPKPYAETEDYLQTAFLGVHAAAMGYDPERGSFLTVADWHIRRACSSFYHWHRRGEVQTISYDVPYNPEDPSDGDYKDVFPDDSLPEPWARLESADVKRDLRAAVGELNPRQRGLSCSGTIRGSRWRWSAGLRAYQAPVFARSSAARWKSCARASTCLPTPASMRRSGALVYRLSS